MLVKILKRNLASIRETEIKVHGEDIEKGKSHTEAGKSIFIKLVGRVIKQ